MFADICRVYFYQFCAIFTETATQVFRIQSKMCIMLTFGKTGKCYFWNRVKYIEVSLMKSSGTISREH